MPLRVLMEQIALSYAAYRQKGRVDKNDPVFSMVEEQFPKALAPYLAQYETMFPEGSTGAGNITAAPWIAVFDSRLTTSATRGYYIV